MFEHEELEILDNLIGLTTLRKIKWKSYPCILLPEKQKHLIRYMTSFEVKIGDYDVVLMKIDETQKRCFKNKVTVEYHLNAQKEKTSFTINRDQEKLQYLFSVLKEMWVKDQKELSKNREIEYFNNVKEMKIELLELLTK